jgi:hypothetical protein
MNNNKEYLLQINQKNKHYREELQMLQASYRTPKSSLYKNTKILYIHMGLPKTGTSSLQAFFSRNRNSLLEKSIDYPIMGNFKEQVKGNIASGNAAFLAKAFLPKHHRGTLVNSQNRNEYIQEFLDKIKHSKSQCIVVSSEFLMTLNWSSLIEIRNLLKKQSNLQIKIVYYMREQVNYLISNYIQSVKRSNCTLLPEEVIKNYYQKETFSFLYYNRLYNQFTDIFGCENVIPRIYEETKQYQGGIIGDFLSVLSVDTNEFQDQLLNNIVNVSLSPNEVAIMLLLNRYKPRIKFSDYIVEDAAIFRGQKPYEDRPIISPELKETIESYFYEENKTLAKELFGREYLFPTKQNQQGKYIKISEDMFDNKDLVQFFGGLLVRFDKRMTELENRIKKLEKD